VQRCYVGVTPFDNAHLSPLGRTLQLDHAEDLLDGLTALAVDEPTAIGLDIIEDIVFDTYQLPDACKPSNDIRVATFTGDIETNWKLSSFSSLTRNVKHVSAVSAPERTEDTFMNDSIVSKSFTPELRFTLKKGADTGNLLHDILEMSDFSQPDFERSSALPLIRYPYFPHDHEFQDLYIWLADVIASPLPSIQGSEGFTLSDISHENALKEVEFYFPVTQVKITEIAKVLAKHRGVDPEQVIRRLPSHNELKGMMHGFIDLIVNWQDCYYVIDYKSTHLGDTVEDYNRATMSADIQKNFYDLQYILYTLALHRFLKKKLPDYDPSIHLGGVYYLYLRGMRQSDSSGVYANSIEVHLLEELDAVFTGQSDIASRATNHAQ
jgi:exodeoxyribonuclease V beta subunit